MEKAETASTIDAQVVKIATQMGLIPSIIKAMIKVGLDPYTAEIYLNHIRSDGPVMITNADKGVLVADPTVKKGLHFIVGGSEAMFEGIDKNNPAAIFRRINEVGGTPKTYGDGYGFYVYEPDKK